MRKKLFLGLVGIVTICGLSSFKPNCEICGSKVKQDKNFKIRYFNGHSYVFYGKTNMVHNPDCICTLEMYHNQQPMRTGSCLPAHSTNKARLTSPSMSELIKLIDVEDDNARTAPCEKRCAH